MNANQKIHNATLSKWLDLFKDQVASGKSVKAWCADNGYLTYSVVLNFWTVGPEVQ